MPTSLQSSQIYSTGLPVLEFPFRELPRVYVPERTVLQLRDGQRIHSYQWCFLRRTSHGVHTDLDLDSISNARVQALPKFIDLLSKRFRFSNLRPQSEGKFFRLISQFLGWTDGIEHEYRYEAVLTDPELALAALKGHHTYLRQMVLGHRITERTAAARDQRAISALSELHGRPFFNDIEPVSGRHTGGTVAPRDDEVAEFMSTVQAIFDSSVRLVLPDGQQVRGEDAGQRLIAVSATDDSKIICLERNYSQVRLMELGAVAFAALALGDSGANLAQIQAYEEPDDLGEQLARPDRVNLTQKVVKFRAGGQEVPVHFTTTTLSRLRNYLQIRECLRVAVGGDDVAPMFVQCSYAGIQGAAERQAVSMRPLANNLLSALRSKVRAIGAKLPNITLRQLRAYKQQDLVRKRGVKVASEVMGHSIATAVRAYCNAQEDVRRSDMGEFLRSLASRVLETSGGSVVTDLTVDIPAGSCGNHGSPIAAEAAPAVTPDCKKAEGCFFCTKFRVHADERDCRKLVSCRFMLKRLAPLQGESAAADRVYVAVSDRITILLEAVRSRVPTVYEDVRQDVEERGNLTPYWGAKLQQLCLLGMLVPSEHRT